MPSLLASFRCTNFRTFTVLGFIETLVFIVNSVETDQMLHSATSDLNLHYIVFGKLPVTLFVGSRLSWLVLDKIRAVAEHSSPESHLAFKTKFFFKSVILGWNGTA